MPADEYNRRLAMPAVKKQKKTGSATIALNRKARFEYTIEAKFEAGLNLQGWEVKALRAGKANISEAYVIFHSGEAFLFGMTIIPLIQSSTHVVVDPLRTRKLLLSRREINRLIGAVERQGYTVVPLALYWKGAWSKIEIGLAKGKKDHDKRQDIKARDWQRDKSRILKRHTR